MKKLWESWDLLTWLKHLEMRHTQEIQLGLERIQFVARQLQVLDIPVPVITVAGTNGKGSTVSALESIYKTAGYHVGTYTSPHLLSFNERIRVNKENISDLDLCQAFSVIEDCRCDTPLTYFETVTLAALWYFKRCHLDVILLEVGLGGRLDATNIIDADVSVITTIDFDHTEFLGDTLESIGLEKAGIIRPKKPVVFGDVSPPTTIVRVAKAMEAPLLVKETDFFIEEREGDWDVRFESYSLTQLPKPSIQLSSAAMAIVASLLLKDTLPIDLSSYVEALKAIFVPGRLELVKGRVDILFDVSHNAQSVLLLKHALAKMKGYSRRLVVFSALKDKDLPSLIRPLKELVHAWYPAVLNNKRATDSEAMIKLFKDAEIFIKFCYNDPIYAFKQAMADAQPGDLIVVYGSFHTVGQVKSIQ